MLYHLRAKVVKVFTEQSELVLDVELSLLLELSCGQHLPRRFLVDL